MVMTGRAHTVQPGVGRTADLGNVRMRVLASGPVTRGGSFSLAEFTGGAGPWTVPHVHRGMEESFFVLDGGFTFTVGPDTVEAGPGAFVLVPRETRHVFHVAEGGGRCLVLWVPGGLEEMFLELAELSPGSLTDPAARAAIAARFDSVPV